MREQPRIKQHVYTIRAFVYAKNKSLDWIYVSLAEFLVDESIQYVLILSHQLIGQLKDA